MAAIASLRNPLQCNCASKNFAYCLMVIIHILFPVRITRHISCTTPSVAKLYELYVHQFDPVY